MNKKLILAASLLLACGSPLPLTSIEAQAQATQSQGTVTGTVTDETGEPVIGAAIENTKTKAKAITNVSGEYSIKAAPGDVLSITYVGCNPAQVKVSGRKVDVTLTTAANALDEVVVTALGIKKDRKSLGYAIDEVGAEELMRNKSANAINSLSGKIAGVNITQSSGAAGSGTQIILRGGTSGSESRDNQPLFVVDGIIYDNSSAVVGNSAYDGATSSNTTNSNRVMDINPEDIESMSVLKGPAASALYGSRASAGVVIITTKRGKEGTVEVNLSSKLITSWVKDVPKTQKEFGRGYLETSYNDDGTIKSTGYNDFSYNSFGARITGDTYDNLNDFFQTGTAWDTNVSVSGGTQNSNFYLSGSYFDQSGVVPETGYKKSTFRFNGEQKWKIFTFGANAAYSEARTNKTLTSGGLYGSSGTGALYAAYTWAANDDMKHYLNEDGSRYRLFGDRLDPWDERDNPYWIVNKNKLTDKTERFTGNFHVRADITDWWWIQYRMGVDTYTTDDSKRLAPDGAIKKIWEKGMMSDNTMRYRYLNNSLMTNLNHTFGDFSGNLLVGLNTDYTHVKTDYHWAYGFEVPGFFSYNNTSADKTFFKIGESKKRLVGLFGELRLDWRNTIFFTVTGRNDWTSTLPKQNRSYFYPSYSGAIIFTEFMKNTSLVQDNILSFGKIRASWAKVGKDTGAYETNTQLWPVGQFLGGVTGVGASWTRGNPSIEPEMTKSTELGLELRFLNNRLKLDYAYYTNDSYNQILSPRGPQSTGYIFCSINAGNVYNKGMELSISGVPVQTRDWTVETGINVSGNRGTMDGLPEGMEFMYLTDVQFGNAKAASISGGNFMAISGTRFATVSAEDIDQNAAANGQADMSQYVGALILDANGLPTSSSNMEVGNREPKWAGGWNTTVSYKDFSFNMLWEFRYGGDVFNGTAYTMNQAGTSLFSAEVRQQPLTIEGVQKTGTYEVDGVTYPLYETVTHTWEPDKVYEYGGKNVTGEEIIKNYYTGAYNNDVRNWITNVKSLRLRSISLSYSLPQALLRRTNVIKRCIFTASANNLLLFTNYDGDPEVAAAGAGRGGSSSVGFDYCGVPSTASFAFGVNLTF